SPASSRGIHKRRARLAVVAPAALTSTRPARERAAAPTGENEEGVRREDKRGHVAVLRDEQDRRDQRVDQPDHDGSEGGDRERTQAADQRGRKRGDHEEGERGGVEADEVRQQQTRRARQEARA